MTLSTNKCIRILSSIHLAISSIYRSSSLSPLGEDRLNWTDHWLAVAHKLKLTSQFHVIGSSASAQHLTKGKFSGISATLTSIISAASSTTTDVTIPCCRSWWTTSGWDEKRTRSRGKYRRPDHLLCNYRLIVWRSCVDRFRSFALPPPHVFYIEEQPGSFLSSTFILFRHGISSPVAAAGPAMYPE